VGCGPFVTSGRCACWSVLSLCVVIPAGVCRLNVERVHNVSVCGWCYGDASTVAKWTLLVLRERLGVQFSVLFDTGADTRYCAPCCEGWCQTHLLQQAVQACLLAVATSTLTAWCIKVLIVFRALVTKHQARLIGHVTTPQDYAP
jgi:hypothetical protein